MTARTVGIPIRPARRGRDRSRRGLGGRPWPARRQGREPGRHDPARHSGAAGVHHHHPGLQRLSGRRRPIARGHVGRRCSMPSRTSRHQTGKRFGDPANPLLVAVRSGAKFSMPGMMDTVLDIGLNDEVAKGMIAATGDERFVLDSYRRLIQMFGTVVLGLPDDPLEAVLSQRRKASEVATDAELDADDLRQVVGSFREITERSGAAPFPTDPHEQLRMAIEAVFESWRGKRAHDYRVAAGIAHDLGTAVNVQAMVFGNMGDDSGSGVAMSRDATTGKPNLEGDYLINAQGEDVVAGIRPTLPISQLAIDMPDIAAEYAAIADAARSPLQRHAGHGVHHRTRQALAVADACGQANGPGCGPHRRRSGQRGPHRSAPSPPTCHTQPGRLLPPSPVLPGNGGSGRAAGHRTQRVAGCCRRGRGLRRRSRRAVGTRRTRRGARATRDPARRRPRHARRTGHPDVERRPHQPRRARGPSVRQARCRGCRRGRDRPGPPDLHRRSHRGPRGRLRSRSTARPATSTSVPSRPPRPISTTSG